MAGQPPASLELNFRQQRFPLFNDLVTTEALLQNYSQLRAEVDQLRNRVSELQHQQSRLHNTWVEGMEAECAVLKSFLRLYTTDDPKQKIENEEFKQWATQYALKEGVYLPTYHVTVRMRELGHSLKPSDGRYYYRGLSLLRDIVKAETTNSEPSSPYSDSGQGSPALMLPNMTLLPLPTFGGSSSKI